MYALPATFIGNSPKAETTVILTTLGVGSYIVPDDVEKALVFVCASGGGGGVSSDNNNVYGSGGGGGGCALSLLTLTPGASYNYYIGFGTNSGWATDTIDSHFDNIVVADPGNKGANGNAGAAGGAGGVGVSGDVLWTGQSGTPGAHSNNKVHRYSKDGYELALGNGEYRYASGLIGGEGGRGHGDVEGSNRYATKNKGRTAYIMLKFYGTVDAITSLNANGSRNY